MSTSVISKDLLPRAISERAYLGDMNLLLASEISHLLPLVHSLGINVLIENAAKRVLSLPRFQSEKCFSLLNQAIKNAKDFFSTVKIPSPSSKDEKWRKSIETRVEIALFRASGWEVVHLFERDVPPVYRLSKSIRSLSCFEYALMLAVPEAIGKNVHTKELANHLPKWGFVSVTDPKPGDVVLFFNKGDLVHMGIMKKQGVLSKPGNDSEFAYIHTLEEASPYYGNQVQFFRRSILTN